MYFVAIGVLIILANLLGIGPMADWSWNLGGDLWKFAAPFLLAIVWWAWADVSGLNKRREIEKMDQKRMARREAALDALGMDKRARRKKQKAMQR